MIKNVLSDIKQFIFTSKTIDVFHTERGTGSMSRDFKITIILFLFNLTLFPYLQKKNS